MTQVGELPHGNASNIWTATADGTALAPHEQTPLQRLHDAT